MDSGYTSIPDGLGTSINTAGAHCCSSPGSKRSGSEAITIRDLPEPPPKPSKRPRYQSTPAPDDKFTIVLTKLQSLEAKVDGLNRKVVDTAQFQASEFIYLGFYVTFNTGTGHIATGSWKSRGNQCIQFVRVLYCKLPTNGKQLPASHLRPCREPNPDLIGVQASGKNKCNARGAE